MNLRTLEGCSFSTTFNFLSISPTLPIQTVAFDIEHLPFHRFKVEYKFVMPTLDSEQSELQRIANGKRANFPINRIVCMSGK